MAETVTSFSTVHDTTPVDDDVDEEGEEVSSLAASKTMYESVAASHTCIRETGLTLQRKEQGEERRGRRNRG